MFIMIAAIVSQLPKLTIDVSTEGFMHKSDPARVDYDTFRDQFGRDELVVIAIRSKEVFEAKFIKKLKKLHEDLFENVPYIEDITSIINARNTRGKKDELIVEDLMEDWPETTEEIELKKQRTLDNPLYKNLLISEDGKMTRYYGKQSRQKNNCINHCHSDPDLFFSGNRTRRPGWI